MQPAPVFRRFSVEFGDAVFDVVDDLVAALFLGEMSAEAFGVVPEFLVGGFLDGDDPSLEVDIDDLFHGSVMLMLGDSSDRVSTVSVSVAVGSSSGAVLEVICSTASASCLQVASNSR